MKHKARLCDKCNQEYSTKSLTMRYPIKANIGFLYFCSNCCREYDEIDNKIKAITDEMKRQEIIKFLGMEKVKKIRGEMNKDER